MPSDVPLIAQVNADVLQDIEITVGAVIAGLLVLSALIGSLAMMAVWGNRVGQGRPALPAAARKPLCVPVPLMLCGLVLTLSMAMMVAGTPNPEVKQEEFSLTESTEEVPVKEDSDSAVTADDDAVDTNPGDLELLEAVPAEQDVEQLRELLVGTLMMNLIMFVVFATAVYMAQQGRSRLQSSSDDLAYSIEREAVTMQLSPQFGDLDVPPDAKMASGSDSLEGRFAPLHPIGVSAESSDNLPATSGDRNDSNVPLELERWNFSRELRFAFETFLVAYLPTAAVRILMVSLLPESPSHPFLEMINEGVDIGTMSLIALMAVVVAPLVEELLYRVTILGGMMQQGWLVPGWIVSSVLFGFAHGFPDSIALLPLAFAIGYVYLRRRSYRTVMLVHLLFNGFNMVIAAASMI
jgi:membrane protease YdiL (CAAX protease family)